MTEVYFVGNAQLPSSTPVGHLYQTIAVTMLVDVTTGEVLDADCNLITDLGRRFVTSLLKGKNLDYDYGRIVADIESRFQAPTQKALLVAFKAAYDRYQGYENSL